MQTLVLSYLAGALTTLNPCVLPMLPFVLAADANASAIVASRPRCARANGGRWR